MGVDKIHAHVTLTKQSVDLFHRPRRDRDFPGEGQTASQNAIKVPLAEPTALVAVE